MTEKSHSHLLSPLSLGIALTAGTLKPHYAPKHLQLLDQELVQLWRKEPGWPRNLMVFMPPGHAKSETCSHWLPAWALALDPTWRVIFASYEADFAKKWGRDTRTTCEEFMPLLGVRIMDDTRAGHRWETKEGGGMVTAGVQGPVMGRRGDLLICDDPIKNAQEAGSVKIKEAAWDWWNTTFMTRRDSPDSLVVLIMTRWALDDIAGRILSGETADEWRVISLAALAEPEDVLDREEHEALWPEKFPRDFLESTRRAMGTPTFNALYQQHPVPLEGFAIDPSWWQWYDEVPDHFDQIILSWDTTFKDVATSDFVCGGAIGRAGNRFYALDCVHLRMNTPSTIREIRAMNTRWPQNKVILIEEAASGPSIIQLLHHELPHILPVPTTGGGKQIRLHWQVNSVAGLIENRQVYLPNGSRWARELVNEFRDFPLAPHDDFVDMLTQGLNFLQPRGWSFERKQAGKIEPPKSERERMSRDMWRKIHKGMKKREKDVPLTAFPGGM